MKIAATRPGVANFDDVDRSDDPRSFVRFLDKAIGSYEVKWSKHRTVQLLQSRKGDQILDVGCGTGEEVRALARVVGPTGWAVGLDKSKTMIVEARKRARRERLHAEFCIGDAHRLEFAPDCFHACMADRVFMYLKNPRQALSEMVRVTKPGGRIVVTEPDWETLVIAAANEPVTSRVIKLLRQSFPNSGIGHHLPVLFQEVGLKDLLIGATTLLIRNFEVADEVWRIRTILENACASGAVSLKRAVEWLSCLEKASDEGVFFAACTGFGVVARKP